MSPLALLPNMEMLLTGWLRNHADIVALDARVATSTPSKMTRPWIRVTKTDATDNGGLEHFVTYTFQIDSYAGSLAMEASAGTMTAWRLGQTARAVLHALKRTVADGVTISQVRFTTDRSIPDENFEPAMERYVLVVEIKAHG